MAAVVVATSALIVLEEFRVAVTQAEVVVFAEKVVSVVTARLVGVVACSALVHRVGVSMFTSSTSVDLG